jgi:hypothetical protein
VLPLTVGIRDGVVHLVSTLGSVVISARWLTATPRPWRRQHPARRGALSKRQRVVHLARGTTRGTASFLGLITRFFSSLVSDTVATPPYQLGNHRVGTACGYCVDSSTCVWGGVAGDGADPAVAVPSVLLRAALAPAHHRRRACSPLQAAHRRRYRQHARVRSSAKKWTYVVGSHGRWKRPCLQTTHMTI